MALNIAFGLVKQALKVLASSKRQAFIDACKDPEKYQDELKDRILRNSNQPFPEEPTDYHFYMDSKDLTKEKVLFCETTSGSTGVKKEIPYTRSLLKSFENMFLLWAHDLVFHSEIKLRTGKFFMSVSPRIGEASNDDRKYLSPALNILLQPFLVSNPNNHKGKSSDEFFFKVSRDLLKHRDLEIFSVWSPTYLLSLLEFMRKHQAELALETTVWEEVWPELKLISCWNQAQAKNSALKLQGEFPNTKIQGKGLLLTEAPITIPWTEANGHLPLLTETYLEFLNQDKIYKLHELEIGKTYIVLSSQSNGYLRYNTQDQVKVTHFYHKTPVLEFIGRSGQHCDLAGEKLSEELLRNVFTEVGNFLVVPDESSSLPLYRIYTDTPDVRWEEKLRTIHHYDLARKLNQLQEVIVVEVKDLNSKYLQFFQSQGMNLGDIKERVLINNSMQAKKFQAWIEKELQSSH